MTDPGPSRGVRVVGRDGASRVLGPTEATEAFRSGQAGVVGDRVAVRRASGEAEYVSAADIARLLREEQGAVLMSDDDVAQAEFEARNPNNTGRAASAAFLRGAVPFVGSRLVEALGVSPEEQRRLDRQHWAASPLAEAGGVVAPMLLTAGSSGAARGAAAGASGAAEAATVGSEALAAERGIAGLLPSRSSAALVTEAPAAAAAEVAVPGGLDAVRGIENAIPHARVAAQDLAREARIAELRAAGDELGAQGLSGMAPETAFSEVAAEQAVAPGQRVLAQDISGGPQYAVGDLGGARIRQASAMPEVSYANRGRQLEGSLQEGVGNVGDAFEAPTAGFGRSGEGLSEAELARTVEIPRFDPNSRAAIENANTLLDQPASRIHMGRVYGDESAATQALRVVESSPAGRAAMQSFDAAQAAHTPPIVTRAMGVSDEVGVALPRFGPVQSQEAIEAARAAARTSALEAGVPVLGREALAAEEAVAMGNRSAFQRILAGALNPIGEAGNAVRGLGTGLAPRAGATALEGSLFGASNYVNQAYLHDEPLSAEGLVMAMGEGAILGAVGELGVSGMTALARRGSQAVASRLSPSFREAMSEGNLAQYFADHAAVRATGANYSDLQKVRNRLMRNAAGDLVAGGEHNVLEAGGVLNRAGVMDGAPSLNVISERLNQLVPERGAALRNYIETATTKRGAQPIARTLRERNAISQELRNSELASNRALADKFDAEFERLGPTRTPAGMHDLRMELDGKIHWDHASRSELDGAYRRMRNAVRQDLEAVMDAVSPKAGSAFRNANRTYGYLAWAQRSAARAAAREGAVANMPLTSLLSGGAAGAILGGVSVKALAAGFVTGAVHQWVKRHGAAIAASGLSALAKSEALNRAAAAINQNAGRSVRALFSGETLRRGALYGATRATNRGRITERQYQSTATNLYRLAHDPEAALAAGSALTPVMQTAPGVGLLAQQIQAARLSYLASLVPGAADPNPLSALLAIRGATEKEKQRFSEALAVGKDPSVFMQSFAAGEVTPQQVADMRAMWPSTYQTMANQIEQELAKPNPVSPEALRTVRIFMGGQVVSETREYLSLMQSSYGTPGSSGPGTPAPGQSTMTGPQVGAIEQSGIATRSLTSQQAAEQRIASGGPGSS